MTVPALIRAAESALVVIDIQERLVPAMRAPEPAVANALRLIAAARETAVPMLLTEQYPRGLGHTVGAVAEAAGDAPVLAKTHFSCMEDPAFAAAFRGLGRRQAVLAGMEAHICVLQTAASLIEQGFAVFVVTDATAARTAESERAAVDRLVALGAGVVTTEMAIYEWLAQAGTPAFRRLLPLLK